MHPRIAELLAYVDQQRTNLRSAVESVPAHLHREAPASGQWSVLEVLDHLRIVEGRITDLLRMKIGEAMAAGAARDPDESPIVPTLDLARVMDRSTRFSAPGALHPQAAADLDAAWTALDGTRVKFRDAVLAGDGLALGDISFPHLFFGPLTMYQWIGFTGAHEARHADQIREAGASLSGPA